MKQLVVFITTVVVLISFGWQAVFTQNAKSPSSGSVGLSVVPALLEIPLELEVSQSGSINITNISQAPMATKISIRPLAPLDAVIDDSTAERYDATRWVEIDKENLLLEPRESQAVTFSVTPPADAGPGGHYFEIVVRVLTPPSMDSTSSATTANPEITIPVLMTVPGDINESLSANLINSPRFSFNPKRSFQLELTNTGNTHLLVQPTTEVIGGLVGGQTTIATLSSPPKLLLPHTKTTIPLIWEADQPGRFNLKSQVRFATPTQSVVANSKWFIVLPAWWIILAIIASGWLIFVGSKKLIKSKLKRKRRWRLKTAPPRPLGRKLRPDELDMYIDDDSTRDISKKS